MKNKVLITGSEGFIGSHLVEKLVKKNFSVKAFVQYNSFNKIGWLKDLDKKILNHIEICFGDIRDYESIRKAVTDCNSVINLAALIGIPYSYEAPLSYVKTNIQGTVNVLEAVRKNNIELVINTSTSETYGTAIYSPIDESHPMQGQSPYSATKISADMLAESYYNSFETPVITVRPFNTYGPRQSARAVIPTIISQLLTEDKLILGDLSPVRDFTYVEDTANGFICAANNHEHVGEVINLGYGKASSIGEISELIMKIMGIHKEIISENSRIRPKDSEVIQLISNNNKAKELIKWEPKTDLEHGLEKTIEFISANLDIFRTNLFNI